MTRFITILFLLTIAFTDSFASQNILNTPVNYTQRTQEELVETKQDKKNKEKKADQKTAQPEIKQVPKSKRQVKPIAVKPNVKVKPIKIIKPKIKKP
ncbi:MAG: hypothetical protein EOP00_08135 [Pedobacter sp.]|nr:MAG: hypothetical protein EOP00_08135 [Pedobacter sp.]